MLSARMKAKGQLTQLLKSKSQSQSQYTFKQCVSQRRRRDVQLAKSASRSFSSSGSVLSHSQWIPQTVKLVKLPGPFQTVYGGEIPELTLKVEQHGCPSLPPERTIVICPSFSHSAHVASNNDDRSPGWWETLVGEGKAIDTSRFHVLCISVLGSPSSPTSPASINPVTKKQWRTAFPTITPTDIARCNAAVLKELGIDFSERSPLHAVVGSSLGGLVSLQMASLFSDAISRVVSIAATGRTTPFSVAVRSIQRKAILSDAHYHDGNYADHGTIPTRGLRVAREVGTLYYRSREEFDGRFSWSPSLLQIQQTRAGEGKPQQGIHWTTKSWEVESYLDWQGIKFVGNYDPNCYLLLSKAMDLQNLGDGEEGRHTYAHGVARITADALLIGTKQDALIPANELRTLAELINSKGDATPATATAATKQSPRCEEHHPQQATFVEIDSKFGHDAFLKETALIDGHLRKFLECGLK